MFCSSAFGAANDRRFRPFEERLVAEPCRFFCLRGKEWTVTIMQHWLSLAVLALRKFRSQTSRSSRIASTAFEALHLQHTRLSTTILQAHTVACYTYMIEQNVHDLVALFGKFVDLDDALG